MGSVVDSFQGSAFLCSAGQMWKTTIPAAPVLPSLAQFLSTWEKRRKSKQQSSLWVYALEMIRVSCERTRVSENRLQHVAQTRRGASQKRAEIMGDGEIQRLLRAAAQTRIRRGQRRIDR